MSRTNINSSLTTKGDLSSGYFAPAYKWPNGYSSKGSSTSSITSGVYKARKVVEVRSGTVTPGFFKLNPVLRPVNAFLYSKETKLYYRETSTLRTPANAYGPSTFYYNDGFRVSGEAHWSDGVSDALTASEIDSLDRTARNKVRLKLKDQKVNLAQVIAERQQTISLLTGAIKSVVGVLTNLKRGNLVGAAAALGLNVSNRGSRSFRRSFKRDQSKAIANGWLQLQYGWLPLLSDVKGSIEALQKLQLPDIIYGKATAVTKLKRESSTKVITVPDYPRTLVRRNALEYSVKYTVWYQQQIRLSSELASLGLTNPLVIAWELMPWSFVIDWFLPIGNALSSLDATVGLSFLKGSKTVSSKISWSATATANAVPQLPTFDQCTSLGIASSEKFSVQRFVLLDFPQAAIPAFKNPLSTGHLLNAMALLRQLKLR